MKGTRWAAVGALAAACAPGASHGNGLAINETSVSAAGKAYAGRSSDAQDASILYGNPAGMSLLPEAQAAMGLSLIGASSRIDRVRSQAGGTAKGDMVPLVELPFGYYVRPLNEHWSAGIGLYAPFGGQTDYERDFVGRYQATVTKVSVITLQPTLAYRFGERLSVGGGLTINRIAGQLGSHAANAPVGGQGDSRVMVRGDDVALGFNLGVLYRLADTVWIGSAYHSKVKFHLDGHTDIAGGNGLLGPIPALGLPGANGRYRASLDIATPESVDSSATWQASPKLSLSFGALWTRWSHFRALDVRNQGVASVYAPLATLSEPLGWRNTWSYSLGGAYRLADAWTLSAGLAYDPTPVPAGKVSTRVPTGTRKALSLGLAWQASARTRVNFAYGYLNENAVEVNQPTTEAGLRPGYAARYKNRANGLGVQLDYAL